MPNQTNDSQYFLIFRIDSYSRIRSKGFRFSLGVWGLRVCSLDVAQPFATVRNRSQPFARGRYGRASAKGATFGGFQHRVASFRVAGVALRQIRTCFVTCQKSFLCGRRNTFASFSEDALQFSWQAQHFGDLRCHFTWPAQHFRHVVLWAFANRIVRAARSGDKVQILWQAWHFVACAEN